MVTIRLSDGHVAEQIMLSDEKPSYQLALQLAEFIDWRDFGTKAEAYEFIRSVIKAGLAEDLTQLQRLADDYETLASWRSSR